MEMTTANTNNLNLADEGRCHDKFMKLFMANQNRIYGFILMCVPHSADADDIMQETASMMWKKFSEFELGTNFGSWGVQIARYKVLEHSKKRKRSRMHYEGDMLETIATRAEMMQDQLEDRIDLLRACVARLNADDQKLLKMHNEEKITVKAMAQKLQRSVHGLYKTMNRINHSLIKCVRLKVEAEGAR